MLLLTGGTYDWIIFLADVTLGMLNAAFMCVAAGATNSPGDSPCIISP